jgi:predicted MPP superfamily phosphohydrolase
MSTASKRLLSTLWDAFCLTSLIGIWPRFIEPKLLFTTSLKLPMRGIPKGHRGIRIVQLSDLHFHAKVNDRFLRKILRKIDKFQPDLIFLTGDFLCRSELKTRTSLSQFLRGLSATKGIFAIPGNHDYSKYFFVNSEGQYDCESKALSLPSTVLHQLLRKKKRATGQHTQKANSIPFHPDLATLLQDAKVTLLQNKTQGVEIDGIKLNITGLGEWMAGKCDPERAFRNYDSRKAGIVLVHNPDALPTLVNFPGELILSGHTHGGGVRVPGIWQRLVITEQYKYIKGLYKIGEKLAYVSRGLGGLPTFRFACPPELVCITLESPS